MHYVVIGLGYGDESKGIVTARLCATRDISWVIRFSGGCQAAHNVITDDGRHHTFAQFGAGTFSGAKTFLSRFMMVEPFSLINEADHLKAVGVKDPLNMIVIDPEALMTTPYHWELNRWLEDQRGDGRHGSTGRGIGMTTLYSMEKPVMAPRMGDLDKGSLPWKLKHLRQWCIDQGCPEERLPDYVDLYDRYVAVEEQLVIMKMTWNRILNEDRVVFEGSQGVLLDQDHGFHPYTTWSKTTDANVHEFLADANYTGMGAPFLTTIGVTRTYMTRHGAGPFVTEVPAWANENEAHNKAEHYQGNWRVGYQDHVALRYAIECCTKIDYLYVTHTDAPNKLMQWAGVEYTIDGEPFKLEHLVGREARAERQVQSEALSGVKPLLVPNEWWQPAESLSAALELPLYGKGWGPKIGDGAIQWD